MNLPGIDTNYMIRFLVDLLNIPSPSGYTEAAIDFIEKELSTYPQLKLSHTRKGALVTKLFDILDTLPEGKTITKREFFDKSGAIQYKPEGTFNRHGERVKPEGFLASWFSALASAKIIQYEGRKGFKKGPRYEEFKKKILGTKK